MRLSRRHLIAGAFGAAAVPRRGRAAANQQLTVLGQALIQYDLRQHLWPDFTVLAAMFGKADVCFTDLETAIRSAKAGAPTRQDIFLHAADPGVLDCLKDWHIDLLATSNNHAFDLGTGGIVGALDELDAVLRMPAPAETLPRPRHLQSIMAKTARLRWSPGPADKFAMVVRRWYPVLGSTSCGGTPPAIPPLR